MFDYAHELASYKKEHPADDLISTLVHAEVDGRRLTDEEFELFFFLLSVAGNDTTRSAIPAGVLALMEHPDQRDRLLADPALMPSAVEEILRFCPPVIHFRRTATRDVQLRGATIRAGDKVVVFYPAANRDPSVFAAPDAFDIGRTPNDHVSFGFRPARLPGRRLRPAADDAPAHRGADPDAGPGADRPGGADAVELHRRHQAAAGAVHADAARQLNARAGLSSNICLATSAPTRRSSRGASVRSRYSIPGPSPVPRAVAPVWSPPSSSRSPYPASTSAARQSSSRQSVAWCRGEGPSNCRNTPVAARSACAVGSGQRPTCARITLAGGTSRASQSASITSPPAVPPSRWTPIGAPVSWCASAAANRRARACWSSPWYEPAALMIPARTGSSYGPGSSGSPSSSRAEVVSSSTNSRVSRGITRASSSGSYWRAWCRPVEIGR